MNVVIALAASSCQISGVQRHGINLVKCLLTLGEVKSVHLLIAPWQHPGIRSVEVIADARLHLHTEQITNSSIDRNRWYYFRLPKIAAQLGADIVHLAYPMPVRRRSFHCPVAVTLHDLYPYDAPGNFGFPRVAFNGLILRQCLRSVDGIACVSYSTHSRLASVDAQLALSKAAVIRNCVESQKSVSIYSPVPGWKGEPLLLCVAQHRANKNLLFLLRVFKRLLSTEAIDTRARLVMVGIQGPQTSVIQQYIAANQLQDRVVLLNGLSDEELQWCYRHCELLIAPSTVEGFGLPVVEALLAGCRVVCSDIPAFREVGGDHCVYIPLDKNAEQAFADAVCAAISCPRSEPVALPEFSPSHLAEQYLELYRSLLSRAASPGTQLLKSTIPLSRGNTSL